MDQFDNILVYPETDPKKINELTLDSFKQWIGEKDKLCELDGFSDGDVVCAFKKSFDGHINIKIAKVDDVYKGTLAELQAIKYSRRKD